MRIDILHTEDCQHYRKTLELIRDIASDLNVNATFSTIQVSDISRAKALHFFGSPSVQINGVDIDQNVRGRDDFVFG